MADSFRKAVIFYAPAEEPPPPAVVSFARDHGLEISHQSDGETVSQLLNRSFPACVLMDARTLADGAIELVRGLKSDPFTGIVPVGLLVPQEATELVAAALEAGADEVFASSLSERERRLRLDLMLRRADRDVSVHPTTRLPGTPQIERDLGERLDRGTPFAVCYADLDHFKEFNDRYGYNNGDRVIRMLSKILRDVVRGVASAGFVGHIGGDDFIFTLPLPYMEPCCEMILDLFDELAPYQYSEADRRAGYFLGKDRRGNIHRIPLMSLSIGVVTNQFQVFSHTAQVSAMASEMKTYAKTLPGSVYVVDRRKPEKEGPPLSQAPEPARAERGREPGLIE
ncbi:MAG: diguanylate cyclase [Gemmatimonadetes bacterium]|nr:diguanylate cyclase [Gemmatimonadota bacterium]